MPFWERAAIAAVVIVAAIVAGEARRPRACARRELRAGAETRYRVLRRAVTAAIVVVGVLSALLVIPQVRAVAGGAPRLAAP